ncbi:MAG TPA: Asp-tRNA(Asn)/Glu-tRNA(Gln) amidotransferase subunit GatB [Myxococcaceae bacterium]|nr:Asp-tRNA(Asn)/Glu-tRNA(Gln) amidotransferase subunit GatB [Myxococcaceae bacterium]
MGVASFQPVIGLEVHAQLLTRSKIFCGCSTQFGAQPNAHTCPVCLGMPGVLPVLNAQVVEFAVRAGLALGCRINARSVWARKNYFYPDLPKGYQISQYDQPLCEHGSLTIDLDGAEKRVGIRRIHMEEDAGKNIHDAGGGESLVDLNRAGVPLIEIVSEPDLRSSAEAVEYLKALRDVLVYLEINDGNLEEGSFRCDANVSVMRKGSTEFGTRAELKNINSFRFVQKAIDHEIARQVELIESGGKVLQETRLWDPDRGETRSMRSKEEAHDYRYFPEPDLPPLVVPAELVERVRASLPELPRDKLVRFQVDYGLPAYDARILVTDRALANFFEAVWKRYGTNPKKLANWFTGELQRLLKEEGKTVGALRFSAEQFAGLLKLVDGGEISGNAAKEVFAEMFRTGKEPARIVADRGLGLEKDSSAVEGAVDAVLAANAAEVEKYRAGKKQVLGFLVGQVMKAMKGKGNPAQVNAVLKSKLGD